MVDEASGLGQIAASAQRANQTRWEVMSTNRLVIEGSHDAVNTARTRCRQEQARRNTEWLARHWDELLPHARGRYLAVAGEAAHVADSAAEAWDWVGREHPDDQGAFVQYVRADQGPRVDAAQRRVVER
jgi:hypothetical protein